MHCSERLHFAPRGTGSAQASSGNPFLPLLSSCAPGAEATALCALEGAGAWALGLSGAALLAGLLLGAATATQEVHKRGKLGSLVECLTIPAANFERAMLLAPPLLWGLLLLFVFLTLLVYASRVSPILPAAALAAAALAAAFLAAARWTEGREASRLKTSRVGALPRPARSQRRRPPGGFCLQQFSQGVLHRRGGLPVLVAGAASLQGQRQGQGELKSEPLRSQRSPPLLCRLPSLDRASAPRASPRPPLLSSLLTKVLCPVVVPRALSEACVACMWWGTSGGMLWGYAQCVVPAYLGRGASLCELACTCMYAVHALPWDHVHVFMSMVPESSTVQQ